MRLLLAIVFLACVGEVLADAVPLTAKEIGLMLRSGYSSEAALRELQKRHFADRFDATVEEQLMQAGAKSDLLEALRNGSYQASEKEMAIAQKKLAAQEERQSATSEPAALSAAASTERTKRTAAVRTSQTPNEIYRLLKGSLVYWHQGSVVHLDDEALEQKKLFLFFFSANFSAPGRKFTPKLVEYYNRVAPQHPEFEVIFFSADRSQFGMETYLGQTSMPWPAVAYPQINAKAAGMQTDFVHNLPCLILVSASGEILSKTGGEKDPKAPEAVLADLDRIFARSQM